MRPFLWIQLPRHKLLTVQEVPFVPGTNGTVGWCKSCVSKEFGFEDGTGLLHERVVVAAAFEDAGFAAAVAVADFAVGDLLE